MKQRIITSILIILVVLFPILLGGWLLQLLGVAVVCCGCYEWCRALKGAETWGKFVIPVMIVWILFQYVLVAVLPFSAFRLLAWWILGLVFFWTLPVFNTSVSEESTMGILSFALIMGTVYLCIQLLIPQHQYLFTLVLATYGSDTGAYFAGRFLGKHKMIPRVSPKKTWEGFAGGLILGFVLSLCVSQLYLYSLNPALNLWLCILAPAFAELGDLCFSSFKRAFGLKDFSSVLPGHGGILDRLDSLIMNFLLFGFLFCLFA